MKTDASFKHIKALEKKDALELARDFLRGKQSSPDELTELRKVLERYDLFSYASEIQQRRIDLLEEEGLPIDIQEYRTLCKCIYKDTSLPSDFRFKKALSLLDARDPLDSTKACETLGLAGAIHKYYWYFNQHPVNLDISIFYYNKGYQLWVDYCLLDEENKKLKKHQNDLGYTALNYAFMLALRAETALNGVGRRMGYTETQHNDLNTARKVRQDIVAKLNDSNGIVINQNNIKWILPTLIEAHFGLGEYDKAKEKLKELMERTKSSIQAENDSILEAEKLLAWEMRTFQRQMLTLASIHKSFIENLINPTTGEAINGEFSIEYLHNLKDFIVLLVKETSGSENVSEPNRRLGLALSGGGIRAAMYHIGVLAALAEENKLKDISVLSCVSGGSIIGTYYYLKLKQLYESKLDNEITANDYIEIVSQIEKEFLNACKSNIRVKLFSNFWSNLYMAFGKKPMLDSSVSNSADKPWYKRIKVLPYSRTNRVGEIYEELLYRGLILWKSTKDDLFMRDLLINIGVRGDLNDFNLHRINKVPQLVINATSLNTGHNWQFTATWMGEPAGAILSEIDVKPRLRRMYYGEAPEIYRNFRLGYAVAASSCVPVVFEPLPMKNLYPDIDLQLVDGGVSDNQGIDSLIEQECTEMIISDASGQMSTVFQSTDKLHAVFSRADLIFQERIRELQFRDVFAREKSGSIQTLETSHLKSGLNALPMNWLYCTDPPRNILNERGVDANTDITEYGVLKSVQARLSEIRTDLDSFHELESYALMYSGYKQTLKHNRNGIPSINKWDFLSVEEMMKNPAEAAKIDRKLKTSSKVMLKVLDIKSVRVAFSVLLGVLMAAVALCVYHKWDNPIIVKYAYESKVSNLVILIVITALGFSAKILALIFGWRKAILKRVMIVLGYSLMCLFSNLYLYSANRWYLMWGNVRGKN